MRLQSRRSIIAATHLPDMGHVRQAVGEELEDVEQAVAHAHAEARNTALSNRSPPL